MNDDQEFEALRAEFDALRAEHDASTAEYQEIRQGWSLWLRILWLWRSFLWNRRSKAWNRQFRPVQLELWRFCEEKAGEGDRRYVGLLIQVNRLEAERRDSG